MEASPLVSDLFLRALRADRTNVPPLSLIPLADAGAALRRSRAQLARLARLARQTSHGRA